MIYGIYGKAIELKPVTLVIFTDVESVRGVVVLSNNKKCGDYGRDSNDEFLLQVEVL